MGSSYVGDTRAFADSGTGSQGTSPSGVRGLDVKAAAQAAETPQGDAEGDARIAVAVIHTCGALHVFTRDAVHETEIMK